jgi:hypothetical protein
MGHSLGITNVTSSSVTIEVASTPQTATLSIGEGKKFELTGDNFYDLWVVLNGITGKTVDLTVKTINEEITSPESNEETTTDNTETTTEDNANTEEESTNIPATDNTKNTGLNKSKIILFVSLILLFALILFYSLRKKNKRRDYASFY